jgi:hypothetical protein
MTAGTKLPGTPELMHLWQGINGLRIAGDAWGHPDDPLVLLQHGGGQTRHAWKGTGEALGAAGYYASPSMHVTTVTRTGLAMACMVRM